MKFVRQDPPPSALLFAIRAIGYNFETAVADIMDNSISAAATKIDIFTNPFDEPYFAFLDNGTGMTAEGLSNAMCLASNREGKPDTLLELGRFGLGLKSASLSQCRRFTVVTKQAAKVNAMTFNIDTINVEGKFGSSVLSKAEYLKIPEVMRLLQIERGTLVVWEDFDRLNKNTAKFAISFRKLVEQAKHHVEYVFHRFYDDVEIRFDGTRVEKRDPFLLDSYGMQQEGRAIEVSLDGHKIKITPYSLPYANALTEEQKSLLGNPRSIYDEQGLYLYRNKRLIAWGSWFRTEVRSELSKLARVKVDIPSSLDDVWMLDVKKSSAKIPDKLRDKIRIAINDSVFRSHGAVRKPSQTESESSQDVWTRICKDKTSVTYLINRNNPLYMSLRSRLESKELAMFEQFVDQVEEFLPKFQIHIDQADDKKIESVSNATLDLDGKIAKLAREISGVESARDREAIVDKYLRFEAYRELKHYRDRILKEAAHE